MKKSESGKKYALIAAICYATIIAVYSITNSIILSNSEYATITALNIIRWVILIGYAVTLFLKNSKAIIFVAGAETLISAYYLISYFSLWNLLMFVASGALVAVIILAAKGHPLVKKLWFLPGAAMMLGIIFDLIDWIQNQYFAYLNTWALLDEVAALIKLAALIFIGMWLKEKDPPVSAAPVNEYATFNPNAVSASSAADSTIGGADKLKMYKELLDSGKITQEEFDAKKKQILGLYCNMENVNIVIKGTPQKNKVASIMFIVSIVAFACALLFSYYAYQNLERYFSFGFGYGGNYYYFIGYDDNFWNYFTGEFFSFELMYGYILIASVIAFVVSIIMKKTTEKCEITVTSTGILGKLSDGKDVNIPLNQVTALNSSSFNGISISSIGKISNFHCIDNRDEVMKAISYLLANHQQTGAQAVKESAPAAKNGSEAEQLKRLKELLDSSVLTQEEFDAKKKQILGL